ncbi:MAG TPA: Uma2 family endonuclease [Rubrobacter sp.]|jgi:Uma2 family endonuclease
MAVVRQQVTANELLHMPDDDFRYELVRGELRQMNPAGNVHGRIAVRVTWRLAQHVEENRLGTVYAAETGFRLASDPDTVRAPDVAFVSQARIEAVGEVEGFWPEAPDLAVEVVSPADSYSGVEEKVFDWLDAGTKMVVVINPRQRSATVYKSSTDIVALAEADVLAGGDIVPGFELAVQEIFA